jgi:hypothetical protein
MVTVLQNDILLITSLFPRRCQGIYLSQSYSHMCTKFDWNTSPGNERCHEYASDGYLATAIIWFPQQRESSKFPASHAILLAEYI